MCVCVCRYILLLVISVGVVEDYMSGLECPQPYMRGCSHCWRIRGDLGREGVGQGLQVGSQEPVLPSHHILTLISEESEKNPALEPSLLGCYERV